MAWQRTSGRDWAVHIVCVKVVPQGPVVVEPLRIESRTYAIYHFYKAWLVPGWTGFIAADVCRVVISLLLPLQLRME